MQIDLFSTEIWVSELNNIDNEELVELLLKREQEESTVKTGLRYSVSSVGGWQSEPDLHNIENIQLQNLLKSIGEVTDELKRHNRFGKNVRAECISMWASVNRYKDYHKMHVHPHCNYSGVYYVKTPENCGIITFIDPRKEKRMLTNSDLWDTVEDLLVGDKSGIHITPKESGVIIFPCFLEHFVEPNLTHEPRISISFNIVFKRHEI